LVEQLKSERDARIAELQEAQAMLSKLIEIENGFMDNVVPLSQETPLADRMVG